MMKNELIDDFKKNFIKLLPQVKVLKVIINAKEILYI